MATSVESLSSASLNKGFPSLIGYSSSTHLFSPSYDKRFWCKLRSRIDTLLENRNPDGQSLPTQVNGEAIDRSKRMKEDTMLLLQGFDSVAQTLSQLSNNIENALQGARDLATPPTLTEIVNVTLEKATSEENLAEEKISKEQEDTDDEEEEKEQRGLKRKLKESQESCEEKGESPKELEKVKKAKNMAISMATKASALARELRTIKSDLSFVQDRCALLEEENRKLRNGFAKDIRPDEDDLVRLQLEALLAEKSRLANENANLIRENQCLHQLVEYHQLTSQDLSAYEHLCRGMCLDCLSHAETDVDRYPNTPPKTRDAELLGCSMSLNDDEI